MRIEKITKLKNGKYKLNIDGEEIMTYDDVILNKGLLFKKNIDDELYQSIVEDTSFYDIYDKALKYALKRVRSVKEMQEYLNKQDIKQSDKDLILKKLVDLKIVSDLMYTKAYINDRILLSNDGLNKIRKNLIDNGIDQNIIEDELSKIDEEIINNKLTKLILKKINNNHKYSNQELKTRILNDMVNLGYDREDILTIIDSNIKDDYDLLLQEYHKQYNKLIKKYKDSDLIFRLKQKLYSKGFNYNDIKKEDLVHFNKENSY